MKSLFSLLSVLLLSFHAFSQSCLTEGIVFTTQSQIDNFQADYPGCHKIEGNVRITGDDISNLQGLDVLNSLGGDLVIIEVSKLTALYGLHNIQTIAGDLEISTNFLLGHYGGLDSLNYIGGDLNLLNNLGIDQIGGFNKLDTVMSNFHIYAGGYTMYEIDGFEQLKYIGGDFRLDYFAVRHLAGFHQLDHIGGRLWIKYNYNLMDVEIFGNLHELGGLIIDQNQNLTSMNALSEITLIDGDMMVTNNLSLMSLEAFNKLTSIAGSLSIDNNPVLNTIFKSDNLAYLGGDLKIMNNAQFDGPLSFSGLSAIPGELIIKNNAILKNLKGLENISTIEGDVEVMNNFSLDSVSGLDQLQAIGGSLLVSNNPILANLEGIESLISIGEDMTIGANPSLKSLHALQNLNQINGQLRILDNDSLVSLSGIGMISPGSIRQLKVIGNLLLSQCSVQSICDYLAASGSVSEIFDNATGCNTEAEVKAICDTMMVKEISPMRIFSVYPNPATEEVTLEYFNEDQGPVHVKICNFQSKPIECIVNENHAGKYNKLTIKTSPYSPGLYFFTLTSSSHQINGKFILKN